MDGEIRRSYVIWREFISLLIALEFASGNGSEERDQTPLSRTRDGNQQNPGKFWVDEQIINIPYYGIYEIKNQTLEVYNLVHGFYQQMSPNERGHYWIEPLGVELGLWYGSYQNQTQSWLRWWDSQGNLLLTGHEQAQQQQARAEQAEKALQDAIPRLLVMGLTAEQIANVLNLTREEVDQKCEGI